MSTALRVFKVLPILPVSEANMLRSRGFARFGATCVCLFFVAFFVEHSRPGYFRAVSPLAPGLPSEGDLIVAPSPSPSPSPPAPPPSEALRTISRFESYGLDSSECDAEFKNLFKEIERAAAHRRSIGNVTQADVAIEWIPDGAIRAMIYRQKLFILEAKLYSAFHPPRAHALLQQIDRAITASPEPIPDIEFSFVVEDRPLEDKIVDEKPSKGRLRRAEPVKKKPKIVRENHTTWGLTRLPVDKEVWIMPDFGYFSWPIDLVGAYEQIRMEIIQNQQRWEDKVPTLLWRGVLWTNKIREKLIEVTRDKQWADVEEIMWEGAAQIPAKFAGLAIPTVDHCAYQYLMHTEGRSYSGRGKYLLNCGSVVVMHKSEWIEPYHDVLVTSGPEQNIVQVDRNFTDLDTKMRQLLENPERAQFIAKNGQETFRDRYLTPAAQACYWRKLFQAWAEVSFRPDPFEVVNGKSRLRGVPFESFVIKAMERPAPPCSWSKQVTLRKC